MGLFDNLTGMLGGGGAQGGGGGAADMIGRMLNQGTAGPSSNILGSLMGGLGGGGGGGAGAGPGGMAGMLEQLVSNGLGDKVSSWLSNNPNLPISPQQIHDALGSDKVREMAQASGLPVDHLLGQLATHLPQAAAEQAGASTT